MIHRIRGLYNKIDSSLDRWVITEKSQFTQEIPGVDQPATAGLAFAHVLPIVKKFDRKAMLKLIVSQQGVDPHGRSPHWEFLMDLPDRRAKLACDWKLTWNEGTDAYGPAQIVVVINPFPPMDSPLRRMIHEGQLLYRQLAGLWMQELQRTPALPGRFRDSDLAMQDFIQQGLDPAMNEFSLHSGNSSGGRSQWVADTREKSYFTAFE